MSTMVNDIIFHEKNDDYKGKKIKFNICLLYKNDKYRLEDTLQKTCCLITVIFLAYIGACLNK